MERLLKNLLNVTKNNPESKSLIKKRVDLILTFLDFPAIRTFLSPCKEKRFWMCEWKYELLNENPSLITDENAFLLAT